MKNLRVILFILIPYLIACGTDIPASAPPAEAEEAPAFALEGIYKGVSWVGGRRDLPDDALPEAKAHGIEWIAQTPFGWMDNQNTPGIRLNRNASLWGEADQGLRATTRAAHAHGIRVMLKPHIWLRRPTDGGWVGEIGFETEQAWQQWESDYRTFILHYAQLAQEEKIDILCIATELSKPVRTRPLFWKALVRDIRKAYTGKLTYAANWYQDFDETDIWSELDYIGVNAYFPLTDKANPSIDELMTGWRPYIDRIESISHMYDKPVLLTEIGYKNTRGAAIRPWEWPHHMDDVTLDQSEQVNAYEAMFQMFGRKAWFRGLFIWKWYPNASRITSDRIEFSPQNKQAADVLRKWYTYRGN